jgi:hypothetical protein
VLIAIHQVQLELPTAGFILGGDGVMPRVRARPGIVVCERVSEVVEAVDAMVKHADSN